MKKFFKILAYVVVIGFAAFGFVLSSAFVAVKMRWTDDPGTVDVNDRKYQVLSKKVYTDVSTDNVYLQNKQEADIFYRIKLINEFYPLNARLIIRAFHLCKEGESIQRMLDAIDIRLSQNADYQKLKSNPELLNKRIPQPSDTNAYAWMNMPEWNDLKIAILKERNTIDSVSKITGVESRMIVMCVIGEQIRLFNSKREIYKKYIGPVKVLSTETKYSLGVTGIKDATASMTEYFLKDKKSLYYLGEKYENLLDFKTTDTIKERFDRLTDYKNHYYSYLYAALILKQTQKQWINSGYNLEHRAEILATLFNLGYAVSKPKSNPSCGGSTIKVKEVEYTFGSLAYDFYYSGEMFEEFPIVEKHFTDI